MTHSWHFFALLILCCLMVQGFYAMLEMACVSFNRVRLQYYVSKNQKRARLLSDLLKSPGQLFGTTLIGVNAALQFGSEAARRFYESLGLSPDFAPLSQVILVLIFAEIAPLLAGRRYAEQIALLGVPILYASSLVLKPVIWFFDLLSRLSGKMMGVSLEKSHYLSREELQNILQEREEKRPQALESVEFNAVVANIFSLKNKSAKDLMLPLKQIQLVSSLCTVAEMRKLLKTSYVPYVPIYHRSSQNIVAISYARDLLRLSEEARVRNHARPPWFIAESSSVFQILKQFRRNNQSVAVVLNQAGLATGILTLDEVLDEIFGRFDAWDSFEEVEPLICDVFVEKTLPGEMKIADFNKRFHVHLEDHGVETLQELVIKQLGHFPTKGEVVLLKSFELKVEEVSLLGTMMISVTSLIR